MTNLWGVKTNKNIKKKLDIYCISFVSLGVTKGVKNEI